MGTQIVSLLTSASGGGGSLPPKVILVSADFPTTIEANADIGRVYIAAANVTDNDPTKTNTGQSFLSGEEFVWDGISAYVKLGANALWLDDGTDYKTISPARNLDLQNKDLKNVSQATIGNLFLSGNTITTTSGDLNLNSFSNDIHIQNARANSLQFPVGTQVSEILTVMPGSPDDDQLLTAKAINDAIQVENIWDRDTSGTPYIKPYNDGDYLHLNDEESALFATSDLQIFRNGTPDLNLWAATATAGSDANLNLIRSRGTIASPAAVQDNDLIGNINFIGASSASNFNNGAEIRAEINGAVSVGVLPCDLVFYVNAGAGAASEGMRLVKDKSLKLQGIFKVDEINELTGSAGVTVEKVIMIDGLVIAQNQGGGHGIDVSGNLSSATASVRINKTQTTSDSSILFADQNATKFSAGLLGDNNFAISTVETTGNIILTPGTTSGDIELNPGSSGVVKIDKITIDTNTTNQTTITSTNTNNTLVIDGGAGEAMLRLDRPTTVTKARVEFDTAGITKWAAGLMAVGDDNFTLKAVEVTGDIKLEAGATTGDIYLTAGINSLVKIDNLTLGASALSSTSGDLTLAPATDTVSIQSTLGNAATLVVIEGNGVANARAQLLHGSQPNANTLFTQTFNATTMDFGTSVGTFRINSTNADCNIAIDSENVESVFFVDAGNDQVAIRGGELHNVTNVNAAIYDLLVTDFIVHVTYTDTAPVTSLTLPTAQAIDGRFIYIKDADGNAGTNSITIDTQGAEKIDGLDTLVINGDYDSACLYSADGGWFTIKG